MFKKVKLLLDSKYIINFSFLSKLLNRYKLLSFSLLSIIIGYISSLYIMQEEIFLRKVSFVGQKAQSAKPSFPGMLSLGADKTEVSLTSLRGIINSWEFQSDLSSHIINDSEFLKLNFSNSEGSIYGHDISKACFTDKLCALEKLQPFFDKNIKVIKNPTTPGFTLRIHAKEEFTAKKVEIYVVDLINKYRKSNLSREFITKSDLLNKMIEQKTSEFGGLEYDELKEELKIGENHLEDVDRSIEEVQFMRNKEKAKLFELELKLKYFDKKHRNRSLKEDSVGLENRTKLEERLLKLQKNLEILKVNDVNGENIKYMKEISKKISSIKKELKKYGRLHKNTQTFMKFQKDKNELIPELTIEKNIAIANVKKLDKELSELDLKRSVTVKNNNKLKNQINEINPEYQLILDLKKQYNQTLIKSSTIGSDLRFESFRPQSEILKPHSLKKIIFLKIMFMIIVPVIISVLSYVLSSKIYSKIEVENEFDDLKILGHTSKLAL